MIYKVRPMIDQMFDFEKELAYRTEVSPEPVTASGAYYIFEVE